MSAARLKCALRRASATCRARAFLLASAPVLASTLVLASIGTARAQAPVQELETPPITNPLGLTVDDLGAALSRPLFSKTRRPPQPPPRVAPRRVPVDDTPALRLMGVMEIAGRSIAIVLDLETDDTKSLEMDETIGNWTVTDITASSLTLSDGGRALQLQLFEQDGRR